MDLVKNQPESFCMPQPMPPVEEERADEPAHEPFRQRHVPGGQLEQRYVAEDVNPEPRGRQDNQQLRQIDQQRPAIPPFRVRQFTTGERPFQDQKENRGNDYHYAGKCHRTVYVGQTGGMSQFLHTNLQEVNVLETER